LIDQSFGIVTLIVHSVSNLKQFCIATRRIAQGAAEMVGSDLIAISGAMWVIARWWFGEKTGG